MSFKTNDLLKEVVELDAVKRMKASTTSAVKYGTIVGLTTIAGGILGGPVGLALGGAISSIISGVASQSELESVPYIILYKTTREEKEKLAKLIIDFLKSKHIMTLYDFLLSANHLEDRIVEILIMFLSSQMHMRATKQ